ncbi:unnamed protein product [Oppiella nova]|uniref:Protein kinase domain-containing protein n=1 Tax=Oppiella nova TaxID=334625 RepID=A0A7R9M8B2_9ACAR|nr:unnamed protein product [Oppiella nova]CAG2171498.1 unnamed protein product [Oppiella nova]
MVYGLGDNRKGCLGLGHNKSIDSPQVIKELCHQNIQTFIIGYDFVLAMNSVNHVYGWGYNIYGQLGRHWTPFGVYSKPERISYFDDKDVQQISCGSHHSLALTSSGQVYGWGCNSSGQIGCGDKQNDRLVFSWGDNSWCKLGHNIVNEQNAYILSPKLIHDMNVGSHRIGWFWDSIASETQIWWTDFDEKEVQNLMNVRSEYVVRYYHSWTEPDFGYIQMELCSQSLRNILEVKAQVFERQSGDPMNPFEYFISCEIFRQILEAVQYLHGLNPQMIHRDLKPENIVIAYNVEKDRFVKLCDLGLATVHDKLIHNRTSQKHTSDRGTQRYMAPELAIIFTG